MQSIIEYSRGASGLFGAYAALPALEKAAMPTEDCRERLNRNTAYHRAGFLARGKVGLYTNWIHYVAQTAYVAGPCYTRSPTSDTSLT